MAKLYIGTSGWTYTDWKGVFYPEDLRQTDYLPFYARHFSTTEINSSFYHLPDAGTCENWAQKAPDGFVFAAKVSKSITHTKRLRNADDLWRVFLDRTAGLGDKLGPLLLQLPPSLKADVAVLERFLESTPATQGLRLAVEFRHASWFDPMILDGIRRLGFAVVIAHSERYPEAPHVPTAPFVYLRFHGPGELFASRYSTADLEPWAARIRKWLDGGRDVYAYFNNDFEGHALVNAKMLRRLIEGTPAVLSSPP